MTSAFLIILWFGEARILMVQSFIVEVCFFSGIKLKHKIDI